MSKIRLRLEPLAEQIGLDNGVGQVLVNYQRRFPEVDIELAKPGESYDLSASHLGYNIDADVHHNHGLWLGGLESQRAEQNKTIIESVRRAKQVIVPSEYVAGYFRRDMRLDPHVVGHGVNWEEWQSAENRGHILWDKNRKSTICDPHPVTVLAKRFPRLPFVTTFVEDDVLLPNIYKTGRIEFDKMKRLVLGTHVYLATTKETFGIGTLQAMSAGIPVVGYNWGGTADIVRDRTDGMLVKPRDEDALVEALNWVMQHRDELGENARERAKQFTWLEVVKRIRSVYDRVLRVEVPDVSIIIPCYNYAELLPRATQSAAEQTYYLLKEIIIVDDGSTDDTQAVAHQLMQYDARIKYVRQSNGGVASARNLGISLATSKYVCCLDADDELKPTFLATVVPAIESDRSVKLGYTKIELAFANGDRGIGPWPGEFDGAEMLKGHNQIPTCCVFEKEIWQRLGGYKSRYCPQGFGAEDAEFWLRFAKFGYRSKLVTEEPLFVYHLGGGTSKDYEEPEWLRWHTDLETEWLPFAALDCEGAHAVTEYNQPLYSIIIPVGPGHEPYLEDALDSVEAQTDKRWECIVVWNMRTDVLANSTIVDRLHFAYPFVKFIVANEKQGAGYARNVGVQHSHGDLLVFLDADDYLQPKFLEMTRKVYDHFKPDWVYTDLYAQTDDKTEVFECYDWDIQRLWRHGIMGVTCLYPRTAFDRVGGFEEDNNREDWDFHMRLARAGLCGLHLPIPLFTYRQQLGYRREYRKIATSVEQSQAMKREDVQRIHEQYDVGELIMACSGCGGNRVEIQHVTAGQLETLTYIGAIKSSANDTTFVGPVTRQRYRTVGGRIINVHPQDAEAFIEKRLFKMVPRVTPEKPITAATPKVPTVQQKTWGEEQKAVNAAILSASNDARSETDKMMREMFGDDYDKMPDASDAGEKRELEWWENPEERTVPYNRTLALQHADDKEGLIAMREAEIEGKNRKTLLSALDSYIESA